MSLRVALVGATGAVGREMLGRLERSSLGVGELVAYTTTRSAGRTLRFRGSEVSCRVLEGEAEAFDLVLASAGAAVSREWSPRFVARGAVVVDNSSAFRADPDADLVVPEVNGDTLRRGPGIVAVPNCSTIQLVMALAPLHAAWGLAGLRVATYQSASGAGARALEELDAGARAYLAGEPETPGVFPHPLAFDVLPHIGDVDATGETTEEAKMRNETRRLLDVPDLPVSATCVRVPVHRGHSEAVWATFRTEPDPDEARRRLAAFPGVVVEDDPAAARYPRARTAAGREEVFVGRIRRDPADVRGLCLWVVADNLLKGAATNAVQIAEARFAPARTEGA